MGYDFEWDPHKAALNHRKHRVSFSRASGVFRDPNAISIADEEHSETEERWVTIGLDQTGAALVVIHTFVQISARFGSFQLDGPLRTKSCNCLGDRHEERI